MIRFDAVTFTPHDADSPVLQDVSLDVEEGSFVLVTGATGSGKSTLLSCINGLVPHFTGGTFSGQVLVDGHDTSEFRPRDLAGVVGYAGQDPVATFVTETVEDEIAYGLETLGTPAQAMRRRVEETMDLLGIADLRDRSLRSLSGGQQQRVAIAAVLAAGPRLLVLDEPTSALDPVAAEDVLSTLHRLVHDLGLTVVLAEHRLERVIHLADQVIRVADRTATIGEVADQLSGQPLAPPVVQLGDLLDLRPPPLSVREARRRLALLRHTLAERPPSQQPVPPSGSTVLEVQGLSVIRGGHPVLREVNLTLQAGSVTALMGRNGSGKSTLLHTLVGLLRPATGSVQVNGTDPSSLPAPQRRRLVGLVPQDPSLILYEDTVAADAGDDVTLQRWRDLLRGNGAEPGRHPRDLSEGQRLALALAIVLGDVPSVLLLDEPTRGLDHVAKEQLIGWLQELAAAGTAVLVATHDVEFAAAGVDRVMVLADGELVSDRPVLQALSDSPAFASQVLRIMWPLPLLTVADVAAAR